MNKNKAIKINEPYDIEAKKEGVNVHLKDCGDNAEIYLTGEAFFRIASMMGYKKVDGWGDNNEKN